MSLSAPAPNSRLLQVALTNVHLFKGPAVPPQILGAIADITGIPAMLLVQADRRIARVGSLAPLRELLANQSVPKADGLRFAMELKQRHQRPSHSGERVAQRLTLAMTSGHGAIEVVLTVVFQRRPVPADRERQVAHIRVCYRVDAGTVRQIFRQEFTITGDRPRPGRDQRAKAA